MNAVTPTLRAHLLAELQDVADIGATVQMLAGQVPDPYGRADRGAPSSYVYPHLVSLERQGLVRRRKTTLAAHTWFPA